MLEEYSVVTVEIRLYDPDVAGVFGRHFGNCRKKLKEFDRELKVCLGV
jgi:hypothetical protein